jgi:hypothetical protein
MKRFLFEWQKVCMQMAKDPFNWWNHLYPFVHIQRITEKEPIAMHYKYLIKKPLWQLETIFFFNSGNSHWWNLKDKAVLTKKCPSGVYCILYIVHLDMSPNHASKLLLKNHPAYCTSQWHSACFNPLEYPLSLDSEIHAVHDKQQMSSITTLFLNAMAPCQLFIFFKN